MPLSQIQKNPTEDATQPIEHLEENLLIITKTTMDKLLAQDNAGDAIALYMFYYYTAKWQRTNQIKATTEYTAEGLKWSVDKVRKIKKTLIALDLIEDFTALDEHGKIEGHYIKVKYVMFRASHTRGFTQCVKNETNALNTNNQNALNTNTSFSSRETKQPEIPSSHDVQVPISDKKHIVPFASYLPEMLVDSPRFRRSWTLYIDGRKEQRHKLTHAAVTLLASKLRKFTEKYTIKQICDAIDKATTASWKSIYEPSDQQQSTSKSTSITTGYRGFQGMPKGHFDNLPSFGEKVPTV